MGYRKSPVTWSEVPKPAMMNANSPICVREHPDWMAIFSGCPDSNIPDEAKNSCPRRTIPVIISMGNLYSQRIIGSMSIPTETKKIAPNRFFTGCNSCSIRSASIVSARIEPIRNAPKAEEKPACVAMMTIPRHNPMLVMRSVSSFR